MEIYKKCIHCIAFEMILHSFTCVLIYNSRGIVKMHIDHPDNWNSLFTIYRSKVVRFLNIIIKETLALI